MSISPPFQTKGGYAMNKRTSAEQKNPGESTEDPLTEVLRQGARKLLAQAVEDEVTEFLAEQTDIRDDQGRQMSVRKDRETLLAFYQFPAEHGQPSRTTNPIESTFATVC